jgi:flagellar motor switch protein FliM
MASILSQDEIDALLTAMQKGELDLDAQDKATRSKSIISAVPI